MNDDTTDFSGQQGKGNEKGFIMVIWLLILFILINEVLNEYGYRSYGGGRVR